MDWRPRLLALSTGLLIGAGALAGGNALATPAGSLLKGLSLPLPKPAASLFAANAIGQTSRNTQLPGNPEELLARLKASLAQQGYRERKINTVVGAWGFNLVMDPPPGTTVDGTSEGKAAALVLQATAIGPNRINLNVRFEGL
ncbi:hypothetical protein KBY97_11830 [Synechococcus sp. ATX 2A4]|uniref:hypothetical protein n=1 Tax=Synechococcus sp. ATX 2A4 TaxID=2823727 RepID=UPI0020CEC922|nr:hypothetical protein [Synechococcus sp. ATX 2A4]MCP9885806.1 hypothetical protein [Synechococcus sp. ATX 2A4]